MPELQKYSYRLMRIDCTPGYTDLEIVTHGDKVTYASPNDGPEISLRLQTTGNDAIPLRPQGTISAPFQRLYLTVGATAKTIYLLVSSPDLTLESRDVNVNNIALVSALTSITNPVTCKDYTLDRALSGQIFERAAYLANSVGNYTLFQAYNPVGSGKTLAVLGMRYQHDSAVGNRTRVQQYNTQLSTLIGTLYNVQSGGAAAAAQFRSEQPAAFPAGNVLDEYNQAISFDHWSGHRPRFDVLGEGEGLLIGSTAVNCSASCSFRVLEF